MTSPIRIHLFGFPAAASSGGAAALSPEAARVAAFLSGAPVELDAELARLVQHEFAAQERYRLSLLERLTTLRASLTARAAAVSAELDMPYRRAGEYGAGFRAARYAEATEAAQAVQTLLNELTEEAST